MGPTSREGHRGTEQQIDVGMELGSGEVWDVGKGGRRRGQ